MTQEIRFKLQILKKYIKLISPQVWLCYDSYCPLQMKLWESNVFTGVCLSTEESAFPQCHFWTYI